MKRILILEPYYGGSHKQFLDGLVDTVDAQFTLLTLPARKWKMRMQLSAYWFIEKLKKLPFEKRSFDSVVCSTFIDVAVFRAMVFQLPGWDNSATVYTYFHENQFAYPSQFKDPGYFQFTAINVNSALASSSIAFNSNFNRSTFFNGCKRLVKQSSDMKLAGIINDLEMKATVLHPGLDFMDIDAIDNKQSHESPTIVWNHRWEHDKNPKIFFDSLKILKTKVKEFRLIVLGQSFQNIPECFLRAKDELRKEIVHFGFVESKQDYVRLLKKGSIVVSTADHEFYGISIIEAVRAGCVPVLPKRLSYPELFGSEFLYEEGQLAKRLETLVRSNRRLTEKEAGRMTDKYAWQSLKKQYEKWLDI